MKQKGVTPWAMAVIKTGCKKQFDDLNLTPNEAFIKPKKSLGMITVSGRTLRKIFQNEHVHVNTISKLIEELGKKKCITNGKIDIKDEEQENNNIEPIQQGDVGGTGANEAVPVDKD